MEKHRLTFANLERGEQLSNALLSLNDTAAIV
jgi:hypothetical protein